MLETREYTFRIDAFSPDTIPMSRLAEYMSELADLLGEGASVHFSRLEEGSTKLVHRIEVEVIPKVEQRVLRARRGEGPEDAIRAIRNINKKLKEDNGSGILSENAGAEIIQFPGRNAVEEKAFGYISEEGSLDGEVIRVGGTKDTVYVHLQSSGKLYTCQASRGIAKSIAHHLYGGDIRVFGLGRWERTEAGLWVLERFIIQRFEPLDSRPLTEIVHELQSVQGGDWATVADPWAELDAIRNGSGGMH